jgi:DNA-binding MarR family transcriptional regulator
VVNVFLRKAAYVLHSVEDSMSYVEIARKTGTMYGHVIRIVRSLREAGLVKDVSKKNARQKVIVLTDKGKEVMRLIDKIIPIDTACVTAWEKHRFLYQKTNTKREVKK